jgi:predicted esterase
MGFLIFLLFFLKNLYCDSDGDCFYLPKKIEKKKLPALLVLSCTGAKKEDIDSLIFIAESLSFILFSCHQSRNHRDFFLNDSDILKTYQKLIKKYPVDTNRVFIYGFSGMGAQALLTNFLHPEIFKGAIAVCAPALPFSFIKPAKLKKHHFCLITRKKDWNLYANQKLHQYFQANNIKDTLIITPGEHSIGEKSEIYEALKWLKKKIY